MDSELFDIEKDSGMESIVSSKDETPERKTVNIKSQISGNMKIINLFFSFAFKESSQIEDYEDVSFARFRTSGWILSVNICRNLTRL